MARLYIIPGAEISSSARYAISANGIFYTPNIVLRTSLRCSILAAENPKRIIAVLVADLDRSLVSRLREENPDLKDVAECLNTVLNPSEIPNFHRIDGEQFRGKSIGEVDLSQWYEWNNPGNKEAKWKDSYFSISAVEKRLVELGAKTRRIIKKAIIYPVPSEKPVHQRILRQYPSLEIL